MWDNGGEITLELENHMSSAFSDFTRKSKKTEADRIASMKSRKLTEAQKIDIAGWTMMFGAFLVFITFLRPFFE